MFNPFCSLNSVEPFDVETIPTQINAAQIKYFKENILCDPHFYLPRNCYFAVLFEPENMGNLKQEMDNIGSFFLSAMNQTQGGKKWELNTSQYVYFDQDKFHRKIGCVFATSVRLPNESNSFEVVGSKQGFLGTPVFTERGDHQSLGMGFFESSTSFVDLIIRPWSLVVGKRGTVARTNSIKATITVLQFDPIVPEIGRPQRIRKMWNFYGCVPESIDADDVTNDATGVNYRQASFRFLDYDMSDTPIDL